MTVRTTKTTGKKKTKKISSKMQENLLMNEKLMNT